MFTRDKWESLPPKTRLRKMVLLLQRWEGEASRGESPDLESLRSVLDSTILKNQLSGSLRGHLESLITLQDDPSRLIRALNSLRHGIHRMLGSEPAEWDLLEAEGGRLSRNRKILPISVYLEDIRSPFNVGSVFRTAEAFGVQRIILSPDTPLPTHRKASRTSRGCEEVVPWNVADLSTLETREDILALETGGTPLDRFPFPPGGGIVLIGSEELGLTPEALELADEGLGRVSIPMLGSKRSLNVSVAFGILIWVWSSILK
jgi:TrmH family RNA methyltransferase